MFWLFENANYPFMQWRRIAFAISSIAVLAVVASIAMRGGLRYSIDFTGGTLIQLDCRGRDVA
jgi:preprotein translocase subunit SecF